jgi:hypothetical protein
MRRGNTGHYKITRVGGEQVQAFIPHPLPPEPPVDLSNARQRLLEWATLALGRLDSITLLLPDPNIFLARLMNLGIVKELTGVRRNRVFAYDRYLAILNEATEPL